MSFYDKYIITQSSEIESEGREETRTDLQLPVNPDQNVGTVSGTVLDTSDNPIDNATIKLCTSTLQPFAHTNTNPQGKFTLTQVPSGSYFISATKEDYFLTVPISVTVIKNRMSTVTITITPNPEANKNIIYGTVKSNIDNTPIEEAVVQLFKKQDEENIYVGISFTNPQGQYLFIDLDDGEYYVNTSKLGYLTTETQPISISSKEYIPQDVILTSDPNANTGVICGIITDDTTDIPIANALVALYSVSDETETLLKITQTNIEGKYLFGDIETGNYRIKSTVQSIEA
ncbi:MSCRAMM family protein [Anaerovorax odorimutans]|uniref:MSCRAMM family protein n=1 Tax=Anaerovorax odorimutans TaxID=109327 RepID=UPI000400EC5B|nr:carboxypeptidase-like regulatory domain-containing protein [Anaerovorax odorimutans]